MNVHDDDEDIFDDDEDVGDDDIWIKGDDEYLFERDDEDVEDDIKVYIKDILKDIKVVFTCPENPCDEVDDKEWAGEKFDDEDKFNDGGRVDASNVF